jgi:hypothetical protein
VSVEATATVLLCEYFQQFTVVCPAGTTPADDADGDHGCCMSTMNGSMTVVPANDDSGAFIRVHNTTSACVGYLLSFHS